MEIIDAVVQFWWIWGITAIISGTYMTYRIVMIWKISFDDSNDDVFDFDRQLRNSRANFKKMFSVKSMMPMVIMSIIFTISIFFLAISVIVGILRAA